MNKVYSRFSRDVTVTMLVYRTMVKKFFWEFDSIIMQDLSAILPLFCTPTWPSHHVSENQVFSRDVTAAMLVSLNKGTAAMLASQLFLRELNSILKHSEANVFFCFG